MPCKRDSGLAPGQALASPMFYLSDYLERHRNEYYARLQAINRAGD